MNFDEEKDEILIEMVAKHPCLYDLKSAAYKNQRIKDNAWKEIGHILERDADECKKRWKNIKDTYRRRKQKGKCTGAAASSKGKKWPLMDILTFLDDTEYKRKSISNVSMAVLDEDSNDSEMGTQNCESTQTSTFDAENIDSSSTSNTDTLNNSLPLFRATQELPDKQTRVAKRSCSGQSRNSNETVINLLKERSSERNEIMKILLSQKEKNSVDLFCESIAASLKNLPPELCNEGKMRILQIVSELDYRNVLHPVTYGTSQSSEPSTSNASSAVPTPLASPKNTDTAFDLTYLC